MVKLIVLFVLVAIAVQLEANPVTVGRSIYEDGEYFQGDIRLSDEQLAMMRDGKSVNSKTGWTYEPYHWVKNAQGHVVIPFRYDPAGGFSECCERTKRIRCKI